MNAATIARLALAWTLLTLAACGGCEGRVSNYGTSGGKCSVLTMPW